MFENIESGLTGMVKWFFFFLFLKLGLKENPQRRIGALMRSGIVNLLPAKTYLLLLLGMY